MKLWHLEPIKDSGRWEPWYDKVFGVVVRAKTEADARALAVTVAGDEGDDAWTDPSLSTCTELKAKGPAGVIEVNLASA